MKRFFFCAAMIAAMSVTFVSCGSKNSGPKFNTGNAPESIVKIAKDMHNSLVSQNQEGATYEGLEIIDHDITMTLTIDESKMNGMTILEAIQAQGMSIYDYQKYIKDALVYMIKSYPGADTDVKAMQSERYNIVAKYIGSNSHEKIEVRIEYYEL